MLSQNVLILKGQVKPMGSGIEASQRVLSAMEQLQCSAELPSLSLEVCPQNWQENWKCHMEGMQAQRDSFGWC